MQVSVDSRSPVDASADVVILPLAAVDPSKPKLPARVAAVDRALGGRISAILSSGDFPPAPAVSSSPVSMPSSVNSPAKPSELWQRTQYSSKTASAWMDDWIV